MHIPLCSLILLLALSLQITNTTSKHLAERPSYLNLCDFNDANLNTCFAKSLKVIFNEWRDGIPGLKSLSPLDPLTIKRIKIQQDGGTTLNLNAELENLILHGVSQVTIKNVVIDKTNYRIDATIDLPKLSADGDYKAKGSVLGFNINGQGKGSLGADNVRIQIHCDAKLRDEGDLKFLDILSFKSKIVQIGDFRINVKNLFGGNKELEDTTNVLFNQNWRELLDILKPALEQAIELVLKDRFIKIFSYVPANYFFSNLPSASDVHG